MENQQLVQAYYAPSESYELYEEETGQFFNRYGQRLRDPEEYNLYSEGYTPFGDEC